MSRTIRHELAYDAPVEAVTAMLADPAFREEVCAYQRVLRHSVSITEGAGGLEVVVDQVQAARGLPSFATRIVGDEINIVQRELWATPTHGRIEVSIPGKPGEMKGTARVEAAGAGTRETVELTVKVSIPLVGGKVEGLIGDLLVKALEAENHVGRLYLAR